MNLVLFPLSVSALSAVAVEYTDCFSAEIAQSAEAVEYTDCTSAEG